MTTGNLMTADGLAALRAEVERRWDMPALTRAVLESQHERRLVLDALGRGRAVHWDFAPLPPPPFIQGSEDLYDRQRRARLNAPPPRDGARSAR